MNIILFSVIYLITYLVIIIKQLIPTANHSYVMWLSISLHCLDVTETHPRVACPQVSERAGDRPASPLQ